MYEGPIVDVDVHHTWNSEDEVTAFLPKRLQDYFKSAGRLSIDAPARNYMIRGGSLVRRDLIRSNGRKLGSDLEAMREQLLDPLKISRVHLTFNVGWQPAFHNPEIAVELCRAANDWSIANWLDGRDDRLYGAIQVSTQMPTEGAKEIRRLAGNSRIVSVLMVGNPLLRPFGDPIYHPIYEAAAEAGLAVTIHAFAEYVTKGLSASGHPGSMLEGYALAPQSGMSHLTSMIIHGVFEKYPGLRVLFTEFGCEWAPWLLWRLDGHYKLLTQESSFVRDLPSEYFRRNVWMSLQPLTSGLVEDDVVQLLQSYGGMEDRLCFGSDYPHFDDDKPTHVAARLPKAWHRKVFAENASMCLHWPVLSSVVADSTARQS